MLWSGDLPIAVEIGKKTLFIIKFKFIKAAFFICLSAIGRSPFHPADAMAAVWDRKKSAYYLPDPASSSYRAPSALGTIHDLSKCGWKRVLPMESGIGKESKRRLDARARAYADEADFRRLFSYG